MLQVAIRVKACRSRRVPCGGLRLRVGALLREKLVLTGCERRAGDRTLGCARRRAQGVLELLDFGAGELEHDALLCRYLGRERGGEFVALEVGEHRQTHTRVAARRLDQTLLSLNQTSRLAVAQQVGGDAILDGAERIVPLELGVDLGVLKRVNPLQPHHRRRVLFVREHIQDAFVHAIAHAPHRPLTLAHSAGGRCPLAD